MIATYTETAQPFPVLPAPSAGISTLGTSAYLLKNSCLGLSPNVSIREPWFLLGNHQNALGLPPEVRQNSGGSRCTGKERDAETGLDYFGARYFSGAQGRFTSPDVPLIDQHTNDPQSWNLYTYVRNNPLKLIDPNGLDCVYANSNGGGVGIVDQHSNSNECGGHGGTWVPGKVNYGENGSANYNQDTGMFQVASNDGKNVYYSTFAAGATTNEAGKCVGGNCNGADIQHADASWLSGMAGGNLDQMMHFMVNRDTPIHGVLLNNSAGAIGEQILSGPLAFWNNHWAGPGGMGAPHGRGDWAAMVHDFNFDRNGITIGSYFDPHISPETARALIQSNSILMRNADGVQGAKMGLVLGVVNAFQWTTHLGK